ncbi:hypothetical protein BSKO_00679 [Bryopsis sp. KO-2023]|nr:hypothetical protein BSKO_00679 [Bryopsis sp. KO-2023]
MSPSQLAVEGHTYQGVHKGSAGYKLLSSMGWKEGEGLGANGQGIVEHIKVKKKADSLGVGTEKAMKKNEDWLLNMSVFDKMLAGLKEVKASDGAPSEKSRDSSAEKVDGKKSKKKRKASKSDSESLPNKSSEKKRKKKKKGEKASEEEGSEGEAASPQPLVKKKAVSHVGRFRRREAAKIVKNYSSTDLAAILGTATQFEKDTTKDEQNSSEAQEASEAEEDESAQEDESSKWWARKFMRAGTLQKPKKTGSNGMSFRQGKKAAINIHGFSEQDQTNLWTRAQEGASKGRKGLGEAAIKKIGGEKVGQGKRTVFSGEESGPEECGDGGNVTSEPASEAKQEVEREATSSREQDCVGDENGGLGGKGPKEKKTKKSKRKSNKVGSKESKNADKENFDEKKLLKIALEELKANGGQLKFRKLCKLVLTGLDSGKAENEARLEQLKTVLGNSRKVEFDGKVVKRS